MIDEALTEIFRNMPGDGSDEWEKTFFGFLSEFGDWHVEKFWVFHKALIDIGKKVDKKGSVDRELSYALLYIQDSVLTHIASHFDPAIDWQFTSIAGEEIYGFKERFELAILGAISGEVIPETSFDLINPLIKNG
ncbi:Imm41 family immunity protein [Marinicella sp. S1101]|uniref:Imm41 family immunity protein n=1 Tax=Marinicella marina TaxID=2996016 RepID=UPI002260D755|nr:Imm41 family immunity protein [Marinicella marina]MCX7553110.1 Imm41 family immunity protein [Marinicella marina]MDJ1138842.1 Imm41 family immunity protein [Marinicella marina]